MDILVQEQSLTKRAFTLIELLVVIGIIALLMSILVPALSRARLQAKIVAVNAELYNIGVALEAYSMDNGNQYPPTRADCNPHARKHSYALPKELVEQNYLPGGEIGRIRFAKIEDKFNKGCAYKYIAVGPMFDYTGTPFANQYLCIPRGFPGPKECELVRYDDPERSPVTWSLFSIGPKYDKQSLDTRAFPFREGFPVSRRFWYSSKARKGILTRIRLKKGGRHIGSFEGDG